MGGPSPTAPPTATSRHRARSMPEGFSTRGEMALCREGATPTHPGEVSPGGSSLRGHGARRVGREPPAIGQGHCFV